MISPRPASLDDITSLLEQDNRVGDYSILLHELSLRLHTADGSFSFAIKLRTYFTSGSIQPFSYVASHWVKTPLEAEPYKPGAPFAKSEVKAIDLAITTLLRPIEDAIQMGQVADSNWLIANPAFSAVYN